MRESRYGMGVDVALPYEQALERTIEELKKEGFGVLTEIDVKATMKKKLDADFRKYVILGACNQVRALGADPKRTVLGGFSQGPMLSCDALLHSTQPYAGLIQLSGTLVAKQEWAPLLTKRKGLPLFQSHGTQDPILPYAMAERLRDEFLQAGVTVDWQPFRGVHEIPEPVLRKLGSFLLKAVR